MKLYPLQIQLRDLFSNLIEQLGCSCTGNDKICVFAVRFDFLPSKQQHINPFIRKDNSLPEEHDLAGLNLKTLQCLFEAYCRKVIEEGTVGNDRYLPLRYSEFRAKP